MKKLVVILDNGHGKNTAGKCSPDGRLKEWHWTRDVIQDLHVKLLTNGIDSVMLVPEEDDLPLDKRVAREKKISKEAKNAGKETLLLSVHINASDKDGKWKTPNGWTGWVAKKNASADSKKIAQLLYAEAEKLGLQGDRCVPSTKYWSKDYTILCKTSCPAVLTENMFQDNKEDVEYLLSAKGKREIVELHYNAIMKYIQE